MKIIALTQARISSSRLPNKVLKKLGAKTVLDLHLSRVTKSKLLNSIIVATTTETDAAKIVEIARAHNVRSFQGDTNDVLDRFYKAVCEDKPDFIVRLTSDCPLMDARLIDDLIEKFLAAKVDYASNSLKPSLPDGMDVEIFTFEALEDAWLNAKKQSEREHVTQYIINSGKFKTLSVEYAVDNSDLRLTLDTIEDYELLSVVVATLGEVASCEEYVKFLRANPTLLEINLKYERNEGLQKSLKMDKE